MCFTYLFIFIYIFTCLSICSLHIVSQFIYLSFFTFNDLSQESSYLKEVGFLGRRRKTLWPKCVSSIDYGLQKVTCTAVASIHLQGHSVISTVVKKGRIKSRDEKLQDFIIFCFVLSFNNNNNNNNNTLFKYIYAHKQDT